MVSVSRRLAHLPHQRVYHLRAISVPSPILTRSYLSLSLKVVQQLSSPNICRRQSAVSYVPTGVSVALGFLPRIAVRRRSASAASVSFSSFSTCLLSENKVAMAAADEALCCVAPQENGELSHDRGSLVP